MKHFVTRITNPSSARARRERKLLVLTIIALLVCWPLPDRAHAAAGDLDPTFGSGGKVTTEFSGSFEGAHDVTIQPDGKIVAAGFFINPTIGFAIVRYKSDGSLDPNFGSGGKVTTSFFGNADVANAIALQDDGKILAAGFASRPTTMQDFALARYNSDGSLDSTFGSGGQVLTDFFRNSDTIQALALQTDGKVVAAGIAFKADFDSNFAIARYDGDGPIFNVCLQDDSNGNLLQFNSATGDYQFTNCRKGIILGGKGSVRVRFCKIELSASKPDHTITALANTCTKAGSASVKLLPSGNTFTISDRDMTNNTCACR